MRFIPCFTGLALLALSFGIACGGDDDDSGGSNDATAPTQAAATEPTQASAAPAPTEGPSSGLPETPVKAQLTTTYKIPPGGAAPEDELPFPAGSVEARWYTSGDRYVVYYDGLALDGPLYCPGNSIQTTAGFQNVSNSPAVAGACEGATTLATEDTAGVMLCAGLVLYVTQIPSDAEGVLYGTVEIFGPDALIGLTSQSPTNLGDAPEVDLGACDGPIR